MRRQDWAVLAFKIIGAAIAAYGLIALAPLAGAFMQNTVAVPGWAILIGILPAWVIIGVGGAFWVGAPSLAARVFPDAPPPDFAEPLDVNSVLQLALALLGTYFVLDAIPQLLQGGMLYLYSQRMSTSVLGYDPERHDALLGTNAQATLVAAVAREMLGWVIIANRARIAARIQPTRVVNPFAEDEPSEPQPS
jgi:hypothetical protein